MWPTIKLLSPTDGMDVAEFIKRKKMTALSGGCVTTTHMQTYAHIIQIFTEGNLGVRAICSYAQAHKGHKCLSQETVNRVQVYIPYISGKRSMS